MLQGCKGDRLVGFEEVNVWNGILWAMIKIIIGAALQLLHAVNNLNNLEHF